MRKICRSGRFLTLWSEPGGFLVVFASGQDTDDYVDPGGNVHTNFRVSGGGEYLGLTAPDGTVVSEFAPEFPQQFEDISYGIGQQVDGTTIVNLGERYMTNPTPGAPNEEGVLGFVDPPQFSVEHGFFDEPFQVEITTDTPGATVSFTTDGKTPGFDWPATSSDPTTLITGQPNNGSLDLNSGWVHMNVDGAGAPFIFHRPLDLENIHDRSDSGDRTLEFFLKPRGTEVIRGTLFWTNGDPAEAPTNGTTMDFADVNRFRIDWGGLDEPVLDGNFAWFRSPPIPSEQRVSAADGAISDRFTHFNPFTMNEWNHVAIVRRDTGEHFEWTWFINGEPAPTETKLTIREAPNAVAWTIAGRPNSVGLDMLIDEIRFSNQALSPEHFLIGQADPNNPAPDATVAYYRFEETSTTEIIDSVTGQVHGTIMDEASQVRIDPPGPSTVPVDQIYAAPITIGQTTTLRAFAHQEGYLPSPVITQTYLFLDDVIQQNTLRFATESLKDDLISLPTMSITTDEIHLFGPEGIHTNAELRGREWERPVSAELIYPDGRTGFQVDAGMRMHGGFGGRVVENFPKQSFRLHFRGEYGPTKLEFPLFDDPTAVQRFDALVLRGGRNDRGLLLKDQFSREAQLDLGSVAAHGNFVHLYINSIYWGLFNIAERIDAEFASEYFGGTENDYDVLKHGGFNASTELAAGDRVVWDAMLELARGGLRSIEDYEAIQQYVDIDQLIDYVLISYYAGNHDWAAGGNNWFGIRKREPDGRFKFFQWDAEFTLDNLNANWTSAHLDPVGRENDTPAEVHRRLMGNIEYRLRFADHVQQHFFNGGQLTPEANQARFDQRAEEIERAIVPEAARWGVVNVNGWHAGREHFLNVYFPARTGIVLEQLKSEDLYPRIIAPEYQINGSPQHGGSIKANELLSIVAPQGQVYFTHDGADPRLPGGDVNTDSAILFDGPLSLDASTSIKARVLDGGRWSALVEAEFFVEAIVNQPGDANGDGSFDHDDILHVLATGKFESGEPATFEEGDWNGDGFFSFDDILTALAAGNYENGASAPMEEPDQANTDDAIAVLNLAVIKTAETNQGLTAPRKASTESSTENITPAQSDRIVESAPLVDSVFSEMGGRGRGPRANLDLTLSVDAPDWAKPVMDELLVG